MAILPFQSNQNRFVIPYYAMTPERFNITLTGLHAATTNAHCYDPVADAYYPSSINSNARDITF